MKTSLYRYYDVDDKLLYVGISHNPFAREVQHCAQRDMMLVRFVEIEWFPDRPTAEAAERVAIDRERPVWNVTHQHKKRVVRETPKNAVEKRMRKDARAKAPSKREIERRSRPIKVSGPVGPEIERRPTQGPLVGNKRFVIGNAPITGFYNHRFGNEEIERLRKVTRKGDIVVFGSDLKATDDQVRAVIDATRGEY